VCVACGIALANKICNKLSKVFSIIGDGENEEGAVWEMAQFAALHKLNNFIVIVDANSSDIIINDGSDEGATPKVNKNVRLLCKDIESGEWSSSYCSAFVVELYEVGVSTSAQLNPKDKTLLLQRRAANKKSNPNKLAPCAGHVTGYDTIEESVIREAQEEYGIDISKYKLNYMRTIRCKNPNNNCFSNHFYILADIPLVDFKIQEEELSEVLYISLKDLKNLVFSNSPEVAIRNNKINEEIFASFEEIFNN
jgi:isopentenyldiphosphate isomerase